MFRCESLIVGAGPAGLAAALYLGRFRRDVLVVDAGRSRALRIPRSHNLAGFANGVPGSDLLATMQRQAAAVGARFVEARVDTVERGADGVFRARWSGGEVLSPAVLLATGATDIEPPMLPIAEAAGQGALRYCPVCDGYEVIDQVVGVVCDSPAGLGEAHYLRHYTPQVHAFLTEGGRAFSDDDIERAGRHGIRVHGEPVAEIRLAGKPAGESRGGSGSGSGSGKSNGNDSGKRSTGGVVVRDRSGEETHCDTVYSALGMRVHSDLAVDCGAEVDADGYLVTDRHQQSTVEGLYCAGDVAIGLNQISVAIGAAAIAASAMHLRLLDRQR